MCGSGLVHTDVSECQQSSEPHPAPAGVCAGGLTHPDRSGKSTWLQTRSGCSSADYLASSDLSMGQKARPKHILLASCSCQTWLGHPCDRDTESHLMGSFPMWFVMCAAAGCNPAQAASHSNLATSSLDIFLESLFRLFQILLADSLQDYYQDKKKLCRQNGRNLEQSV